MDEPKVAELEPEIKRKNLPPYHVIVKDDDDHTYEYVVRMLMKIFLHTEELAFGLAEKLDNEGQVIVDTTSKERAEFKQEQIHGYGRDHLIERCQGSMTCVIEPAE